MAPKPREIIKEEAVYAQLLAASKTVDENQKYFDFNKLLNRQPKPPTPFEADRDRVAQTLKSVRLRAMATEMVKRYNFDGSQRLEFTAGMREDMKKAGDEAVQRYVDNDLRKETGITDGEAIAAGMELDAIRAKYIDGLSVGDSINRARKKPEPKKADAPAPDTLLPPLPTPAIKRAAVPDMPGH